MTSKNDKASALLQAMQKKPAPDVVQAFDITEYPELGKAQERRTRPAAQGVQTTQPKAQTPQKSAHGAIAPSKSGFASASNIFDNFVESILLNGGYLNPADLVSGLSSQLPELNKLERFRNVQTIGRTVNSAVACYWHGRTVRTYCDMEQAVIGQLARYFKTSPVPKTFEEFGVGCLCKNDSVVKLFGEISPQNMATVSSQDIMVKMFEFLRRNNPRIFCHDERTEIQFQSFLRQQLGSVQGVNVDFKPLFISAWYSLKDWNAALRQTKENCNAEYAKSIKMALDAIVMRRNPDRFAPLQLTRPSPTAADGNLVDQRLGAHFLSSIGIDILQLASSLQGMLAESSMYTGVATPFVDFACNVARHRGINKHAGVALGVVAVKDFEGSLLPLHSGQAKKLIYGDDSLDFVSVVLERALPAKVKTALTSVMLSMLVYLLNTQGAPSTSDGAVSAEPDANELDDGIRTWFDHNLVADIPPRCLSDLITFLKRLVDPQVFIKIENGSSGAAPAASLNWEHVKQQIEDRLKGVFAAGGSPQRVPSKKPDKKAKKVPADEDGAVVVPAGAVLLSCTDYVAVLTSCILYHRILSIELEIAAPPQAKSTADADGASELQHIVCALVAEKLNEILNSSQLIATCHSDGPTAAIVEALQQAERSVTTKLRIPVFECAKLGGSFSWFLHSQLSSDPDGAKVLSREQNSLRDAVQLLYSAIVGPSHADREDAGASNFPVIDDDPGENTDQDNGLSAEQVLQAVSDALSAVVGAAEFTVHTSTGQPSALFRVLQLAQAVEARMQDDGVDVARAEMTLTSALHRVCASDSDLAARVETLVTASLPLQRAEQTDLQQATSTASNLSNQHSQVSLDVAALALAQHRSFAVDSAALPTSFDTLSLLRHQITQCLQNAFQSAGTFDNDGHLVRLADKLIAKLRAEGIVEFNATSGRVDVQWPSQLSSLLTFEHFAAPPSSEIDREEDNDPQAWNNTMVKLLAAVPYGTSCAESTLWAEMSNDAPSGTTMLDFVLSNEVALRAARPSDAPAVYYVIPGSADSIPLPSSTSRDVIREALLNAIHRRDFAVAAAFCMSAARNLIDAPYLTTVLNAYFLEAFESLGIDALSRLAELVLRIASALPISCTATSGVHAVLRMCMDAVSAAAKISQLTAQHAVVEAARGMGTRFLRFLAVVGRSTKSSNEFPVFSEFAKEWILSPFSANPQADASKAASPAGAGAGDQIQSSRAASDSAAITKGGTTRSSSVADSSAKSSADGGDADVAEKKAFILRLLQEDFGYTHGGLTRPSVESSEGRKLQNALDLLSASLYSSQVHFVMELIQNADDNKYAAAVVPTIRLELYPHAVLVYNNEEGFSIDNIVAVCNVGRSTKAQQTGYIGQKGIGFKSVFSISDAPEIHSQGFHIGFNKQVSMLEPNWLEPTSTAQWPARYDSGGTYYETCLRLKLDQAALKSFAKLNQDIQGVFNGKLILFLNKLQRMILEDRTRNTTVEHTRTRLSDNWMSICIDSASPAGGSSSSELFWLVLKTAFSPLVRRVDVSVASTEVAIAFKFVKTQRTFKSTRKFAASPASGAETVSVATAAAEYMDADREDGEIPQSPPNTEIEYLEEIRLDFQEGLMPIYAYLPTSTCCFRFMVQGDFVLPTNRESILEQNEWNLGLLEQVPGLFVAAIKEMALWCELSPAELQNGDAICASGEFLVLSQLLTTKYQVRIEPGDILLALPRLNDTSKDYINTVVRRIYEDLQDVRCLQSSTGTQCRPAEIIAVHHLDFEPQEYISEDLLLHATGCRYAMHDVGQYELDDQLTMALSVRKFDMTCVMKCVEFLAAVAAPASVDYYSHLAGVLLALEMLGRQQNQGSRGSNIPHSTFTASKVLPKHNGSSGPARHLTPAVLFTKAVTPLLTQVSAPTTYLPDGIRSQCRHLRVWPDATGTRCSLDTDLLFMQSKQTAFNTLQQACLEVFKAHLRTLDPRLLEAAGKIVPRGADILSSFLLENFKLPKQSSASAPSGELNGTSFRTCGGIEGLTAEVVLTRVIFPVYQRFAAAHPVVLTNDTNCVEAGAAEASNTVPSTDAIDNKVAEILDRRTAAAFLAFFYSSNWGNKLNVMGAGGQSEYARFVKETGVVVPVLTARERNNSLHFNNSSLLLVKKIEVDQCVVAVPSAEVHLGAEVSDSAVSALASPQTSTALRQLAWTVVDPLVASFALGVKVPENQVYAHVDITAAFRGTASEELVRWKEFQLRLGVVNFFGVYQVAVQKPTLPVGIASTAVPAYQAPHLLNLISHLTRNGKRVNTDLSAPAQPPLLSGLQSLPPSGEPGITAEVTEYVPAYVPSVDTAIMRVSKEVHDAMTTIAHLLAKEVETMKKTKASKALDKQVGFLYQLNVLSWVPIVLHPLLQLEDRDSAPSARGQDKAYYVGKAHQITANLDHKRYGGWGLGPHAAYLPQELVANEAFRSMLDFPLLKRGDPPAPLLVGYWKWLSAQARNCVWSNVLFMRYIYEQIQRFCADQEASASNNPVVQQVLDMFRIDAALIWIPDTAQTVDGREYFPGRMFPLSRVVKEDPSEKLHFDTSPVKSLAQHYGAKEQALLLFSRSRYCNICQAAEGMFGTTGGLVHFASAERQCTCKAEGAFCKLIDAAGRQVVRKSPGASDMTLVLRHHCARMEEVTRLVAGNADREDTTFTLTKAQRAALMAEKDRLSELIAEILTTLSLNSWKCFQIARSLHPYSSKQLLQLKNAFAQDRILPTVECRSFVRACATESDSVSIGGNLPVTASQQRLQIALDDLDAFRLFESDLGTLSERVDWIEVHSPSTAAVSTLFVDDTQTGLPRPYCLTALAQEEQQLLALPTAEFEQACRSISALTFFAPPNRLALFDFLGIPKLSSYITVDWLVEKQAQRCVTAVSFVTVMNSLLSYTQAYFYKASNATANNNAAQQTHHLVDRLKSSERLSALFKMEVVECVVLQRKLHLALADVSTDNTQDAAFRRDANNADGLYTLYLSSTISAPELQALAVSLLMSAVRVEVALIEVRHDAERMEALRAKLTKVASKANDPAALQMLLDFDDLNVVPENCTAWELANTDATLCTKVAEMAILEEYTPAESHSDAVDAYKKMQEASRERRKNAQPAKAVPKVTAEAEAFAAYQQTQQLKMQALGEAVATTVSSATPTLSNATATTVAVSTVPVTPTTSGPAVINDDPVQHSHLLPTQKYHIGSSMVSMASTTAPVHSTQSVPMDSAVAFTAVRLEHGQVPPAVTQPSDAPRHSAPHYGGIYTVSTRAHTLTSASAINGAAVTSRASTTDPGSALPRPYYPGMPQPAQGAGNVDILCCDDIADEDKIIVIPDLAPGTTGAGAAAAHGDSVVEGEAIKHQNFASGRIGEELAVKQLRRRFTTQSILMTPTERTCTAVRWLNEHGEAGLPYDIQLEYSDGSTKHCEVKTRSVPRILAAEPHDGADHGASSANTQWIMSPAEVAQAHAEKDAYFCVFINLCIDHGQKQVELRQSRIVGYERGLVNAVYVDQARLILQLNE